MGSLDPIALYFKEIRKTPPLSQEEFNKHWKKFQTGEKAAAKLKKNKSSLSAKERVRLEKIALEGAEAKTSLVVGNLRLVIPIVKRRFRSTSDFLDLVEEGNIGLIHALKKFDPSKGFRFSTYASYWIDQAVRRSIEEQSKTIRIPPHARESLRKWYRELEVLTVQLGRAPSNDEMSAQLGLTVRQTKSVLEAVEASKGIGSLDVTLDEDENLSLKDMVSDGLKHEPEHIFLESTLRSDMEQALSMLPEREREIVEMRFGVDGGESATLEEIGQKYKISRERVRQIQERAMLRLKHIVQKMGLG